MDVFYEILALGWTFVIILILIAVIILVVSKIRKKKAMFTYKTPFILFILSCAMLVPFFYGGSGTKNQSENVKEVASSSSVTDTDDVSSSSIEDTESEKVSSSSSSQSVSLTEEQGYQQILDEYTKKLQEQTPKSIQSYDQKAASNQNGVIGLAEISTAEVQNLAVISTEGTQKMAQIALRSGNQDMYQMYAGKLNDVYMAEGEKITNHYMSSIMGQ